MKKALSLTLICAILMAALTAFVSAADSASPFDLKAPTNVSAVWLEENDSPTTINLSYTIDNSITAFYSAKDAAVLEDRFEEFIKPYGVDDVYIGVQIDWALDNVDDPVSGWHMNKYWDGSQNDSKELGKDSDYNNRYSEWDVVDSGMNNATETVQNVWIMRGVPNDERWNGNPETHVPGVKDQLNPDQYTYNVDEDTVRIDFTKHTFYFRVRLVRTDAYTDKNGDPAVRHTFSDWSAVCAVGKDAVKVEPVKKGELAAPVITGLRKTDKTFNDNPIVAFTLTVPDALQTQLANASALGGGIRIYTEARVKGDTEWTEMQNSEFTVSSGERECPLIHLVNDQRPTIPADTVIELRCRYFCTQPGQDDFYSDYSKIISFGTDDINAGKSTPEDGKSPLDDGNPSGVDKCPICHFCPQPLGLCIFIWLLIILIIIIIIIVIIVVIKKKKDKEENRK